MLREQQNISKVRLSALSPKQLRDQACNFSNELLILCYQNNRLRIVLKKQKQKFYISISQATFDELSVADTDTKFC